MYMTSYIDTCVSFAALLTMIGPGPHPCLSQSYEKSTPTFYILPYTPNPMKNSLRPFIFFLILPIL